MTSLHKKTIKDYAIIYQQGNEQQKEQVINDLIKFNVEYQSGDHDIRFLTFTDNKMNGFLKQLHTEFNYNIPREDIETAILELFYDTDSCLLDDIDISYSANEIVSYVSKRMRTKVLDLRDELIFNKEIISESLYDPSISDESIDDSLDDSAYSMYEQSQFNEWIEVEYSGTFSMFIELQGGLDQVLTERQFEVVTMSNIMPQRDIAERLDVSEANISNILTQADKRLKKAYLSYRTAEVLSESVGKKINETVRMFLDDFSRIVEFDANDTFDYFGYIIDYFQKNSSDKDFRYDYDFLQANKLEVSLSVFDVLVDNIKVSQQNMFKRVLSNYVRDRKTDYDLGKDKLTKRQKERFVIAVLAAFNKYMEVTEDRLNDNFDVIVDRFSKRNNEARDVVINDDYDEIIALIS